MYYNSISKRGENMSFGERLKVVRKEIKYSQEKLGKLIGYGDSTITGYENGTNKPNLDIFIKLCKIFDRDPNYFLQDYITGIAPQLNPEDQYIIDRYKSLTLHDKEIVDHIFNMKPEIIKPIIRYESIVADDVIYFPLVRQKASAGIGDTTHQSSNETNRIGFPLSEVPEGVTHAIVIDGFSMEPMFFDGQIVFINAGKDCNDGDFGIFQVTTPDKTDVYCKQLKYDNQGRKYLHSVSERADDPEFIESDETILQCIGKIITK